MFNKQSKMRITLVLAMVLFGFSANSARAENHWFTLSSRLIPIHESLNNDKPYHLVGNFEVEIDGHPQKIALAISRYNSEEFEFSCTHKDYSLEIQRRKEVTVLSLPHHKVRFVGTGDVKTKDHLAPENLISRLFDADSQATQFVNVHPTVLAVVLSQFAQMDYQAEKQQWQIEKEITISIQGEKAFPCTINLAGKGWKGTLEFHEGRENLHQVIVPENYKTVEIDRNEIERQLVRGVRRAAAILAPAKRLIEPVEMPRKVENGQLQWHDGQRVVLLSGTPEQIGTAHAKLLQEEAVRCMDSVLNTFGTLQTIRSGRWFRHDLDKAYAKVSPHIPEDHKKEMRALADELGWDRDLVLSLNIFPELFHCSGFAVFGSATKDGKLYHGRVLDYMTTIGLQDSCVTYIIAPQGKNAFANVGYGGFVGSVSGMNEKQISLGEMGGKGEGQWDGVPMATLMRRALEECNTLEEVKTLWAKSPRTCEYYYVFSDGKTNQCVGVAATPEKIVFIEPGQSHELLGEGIEDAVVLSAGSRLEKLRERVQEKHGQIDTQTAIWLMSRPVAMQSNLHNVLFVPEDGVLYVANADHKRPAAERPYVKINLRRLLEEIKMTEKTTVSK